MFYVVLLLLVLLIVVAIVVASQNYMALLSSVHLTLFSWHLPGIPLFLLCLLSIFLGGLLLYVVSSFSARRDALELARLRTLVEKLSEPPARSPSGALPGFVTPPVVPIPGIPSNGNTSLLSRRVPTGPVQNPAPSAAFSHLSFSPGQGQNFQAPQSEMPRPPFFSQ